jgi:hypothetical protein
MKKRVITGLGIVPNGVGLDVYKPEKTVILVLNKIRIRTITIFRQTSGTPEYQTELAKILSELELEILMHLVFYMGDCRNRRLERC